MTKLKDNEIMITGTAQYTRYSRTPNEEGTYEISISDLDEGTKQILKDHGIKIKNKDKDNKVKNAEDGKNRPMIGDFVSLKTKFKPSFVNLKDQELDENVAIGNGSTVKTIARTYNWDNKKGKKGTSLGFNKVLVKNLVTVETKDSVLFDGEQDPDLAMFLNGDNN